MWGISHRRANWPCVPPLHSKVIGIPVCNACTLPAQKLISPTQQSSRFGLCYLQYPTSGYWILWVIELYLAVFRNPTKWPNPYEVYFSPITRSLRQAVWELMQLLKESGSFSPFLPSLKVNTSVAQLHQTQTSWTVACQAFLSMEFSRQEYQSGQTFPSPGDLPDPGLKPRSPALQVNSLPSEPPGSPAILGVCLSVARSKVGCLSSGYCVCMEDRKKGVGKGRMHVPVESSLFKKNSGNKSLFQKHYPGTFSSIFLARATLSSRGVREINIFKLWLKRGFY